MSSPLTESRAEVAYTVMKKVLPIPTPSPVRTEIVAERISQWVNENEAALLKAEPWLETKSRDFLHSPGWLKRHMRQLEGAAFRDGAALLVESFKGCRLTRSKKEIERVRNKAAQHLTTRLENYNYGQETLQNNPKWKGLALGYFNQLLLPEPPPDDTDGE